METASVRVESTVLGLDYASLGSRPVQNLVGRSGPWDYCHPEISDANFPIHDNGFVSLGYVSVSGHDFKLGSRRISSGRVAEEFRIRGLRLAANAVEALWLLVQNKRSSFYKSPLVILVQNSQTAFIVTGHDESRRLFLLSDGDIWSPYCTFVGVYEQH